MDVCLSQPAAATHRSVKILAVTRLMNTAAFSFGPFADPRALIA